MSELVPFSRPIRSKRAANDRGIRGSNEEELSDRQHANNGRPRRILSRSTGGRAPRGIAGIAQHLVLQSARHPSLFEHAAPLPLAEFDMCTRSGLDRVHLSPNQRCGRCTTSMAKKCGEISGSSCYRSIVFLGRNCRGNWVARSQLGTFGGLFLTRGHALKYAPARNGYRPDSIVELSFSIELDLFQGPTKRG